MKLFRRLLLSLFPEEFTTNAQHPVRLFLSLISPKQLFTIIHRRIAENYKLNLYDIALDPFEVNIGFGEQPTLQVKEVDTYYAYGVAAHMNGPDYYAPGNLATLVAFVVAIQGRDIWRSYPRSYGYMAIMTTYLLTFVFVSRLRIFPEGTQQERYQRSIEVFFEFYLLVARQQGVEIDEKLFAAFKKELLLEVQLFFFLFYFYQKINELFARSFLTEKQFYSRLFADELRNPEYKQTIETFISNRQEITTQKQFGSGDTHMGKLVFPADIQLRYILQGDEGNDVVDRILTSLYDRTDMDEFLRSFLTSGDRLDEFLMRLFDYRVYQEHYFVAMQQMSQQVFRLQNVYEDEQEIDAFMSSLESGKQPGDVPIPESLKKESAVMDKLMNFYVSFVEGLWTARGDAFGLRLFKRSLVDDLMITYRDEQLKQDALQRYGGLFYTYSKNLFYYASAYEHIRAGKEVFHLPYKSSYKEVYSHMYLLKLFDEHFLYTLLADLSSSSIIITVSQSQVVTKFKHLFHERLRTCLDSDQKGLITYLYGSLGKIMQDEQGWIDTLNESITDDEYAHLKESIYMADMHIWVHACEYLAAFPNFFASYGKMGTVGIAALLKETLFGFLLYVTYIQLQERETGESMMIQAMKHIYVTDVLQITSGRVNELVEMIDTLLIVYHPLLELWINLDDNLTYFALGAENRKQWIKGKSFDQIMSDLSGDDIVRCRGRYKTITYYNKRIIRPKNTR